MGTTWKKWMSLFGVGALFLGACETDTEEQTNGNEENQEETPVEEEVNPEEVVENIQQALEDVDSYSVRLNLLQVFDGNEEADMLVGMDLDATREPARMRGDISVNDQIEGSSMEMDVYFTEEESYSRNQEMGYWSTESTMDTETMIPSIFQRELELLLEKSDYVEIEESGSDYILTLNVEGEEATDIPMSVTLPFVLGDEITIAGGVDPTEASEGYTIEEYEYELRVDRETYLPSQSDNTVTGEFDTDQLTGPFEQEMRYEMLGWDTVDEIEEPEDLEDTFESTWDHEMGGDPAEEEQLEELAEIAEELESYALHDITEVEYRGEGFVEEQTIELMYEVLADHSQGHIEVDVSGQIENTSMDIYLDEDALYYREGEAAYQELPNDLTELGMNQEISTIVSTLVDVSDYLYTREENGKFIVNYEGEDPEVFQAFLSPLAMDETTQNDEGLIRLYMVFDEETGYLEQVDVEMEFAEAGFTMFVDMDMEVSQWNEVEPDPIPEEVLEEVQ